MESSGSLVPADLAQQLPVNDASTTRVPVLEAYYRRFLKDEDTTGFIQSVAKRYTAPTLERLARCGSAPTRRAALLSLGFIGDYGSNQVVAEALFDSDRAVRLIADNAVRTLWGRDGAETHRQQLSIVMRLNGARRYEEAIKRASELIREAPEFAEAYNQRAIASFHLRDLEESIEDCCRALELNPYHFGAASGMGQSYLELGHLQAALSCFRKALEINPGLDSVRRHIQRLERTVDEL